MRVGPCIGLPLLNKMNKIIGTNKNRSNFASFFLVVYLRKRKQVTLHALGLICACYLKVNYYNLIISHKNN